MEEATLVNKVRHWRKTRGLTQTALAERVGITRQSIIAIEKGRLNPSIAVVLGVAEALHATVEELFMLVPAEVVKPEKREHADGSAAFQIGPEAATGEDLSGTGEESPDEGGGTGAVWDFV